METVTFLDILDEEIDEKSINLSPLDLMRALETIWDLFFGHLGYSKCLNNILAGLAVNSVRALTYASHMAPTTSLR